MKPASLAQQEPPASRQQKSEKVTHLVVSAARKWIGALPELVLRAWPT